MQSSMNSLANVRKASQPEFYHNRTKDEQEQDSDYDSFRSRTLSNISAPGGNHGSQISPTFNPNNDDFNYSSWASNTTVQPTTCNNTMNDLMSRTDQICLDADSEYSQMAPLNSNQQQLGVYSTMPQQISPNYQIKQEEIKPQFQQQNSYQELKVVRGVDQQMQNPLLRNQYSQQNQFQQQTTPQFTTNNQTHQQTQGQRYPFGCNGVANQQRWQTNNNNQQQSMNQYVQPNTTNYQNQQMTSAGTQQQYVSSAPITQQTTTSQQYVQVNTNLPKDLENLNTFVPPNCEIAEIDEIIRQELSTSDNLQFDF